MTTFAGTSQINFHLIDNGGKIPRRIANSDALERVNCRITGVSHGGTVVRKRVAIDCWIPVLVLPRSQRALH